MRRDALGDAANAEAAGSGNFMLTVPILNLPGRGLDLNLALTYNSQIWHDGDDGIVFDPDNGWPAPGWSLGFGKLVRIEGSAMLVDSDGTRHPFTALAPGTGTFSHHTTDGSLIDYTVYLPSRSVSSADARYPNGTVVDYSLPGELNSGGIDFPSIYPTRITDANGNYVSIRYRNDIGPAIDTITDTLGRVVSFHYDANNLLTAISGPSLNGGTRVLIRLHYRSLMMGLNSMAVIDAIFYPATNTGYWFGDTDDYSANGILKNVSERRAMNLTAASLMEQGTVVSSGTMTRQRTYNYPGSSAGSAIATPKKLPTYSTMIESWSDMDSAPSRTTYATFQISNGQRAEITYPDGGRYVLTTHNSGLESQTELYDAGNRMLRKSTIEWETGAYGSPRVKRVETTDELNQVTAQEFSYGPTENQIVESREYDYGGTNLLRKVHTDYLADPSYTKQHILSLPVAIEVYDVISGSLASRTEYLYDTETAGGYAGCSTT